MKYRKLITGKRVREATEPIKWVFESHCPAKWLHIDLESGRVYVRANAPLWREPTQTQIDAGRKALKDWRPR